MTRTTKLLLAQQQNRFEANQTRFYSSITKAFQSPGFKEKLFLKRK
jgi:hypothetical protein